MSAVDVVLLGLDSLIACLALGPIVGARTRVPLAVAFGLADGLAFLIGHGLGVQVPEGVAAVVRTGILLAFGVYLLLVANLASRLPIWLVPVALGLDNLTFGLVDDDASGSPLAQALWQTLSSGVLAAVGLSVAVLLPKVAPALRERRTASRVAGGGLIVASGVLLLT